MQTAARENDIGCMRPVTATRDQLTRAAPLHAKSPNKKFTSPHSTSTLLILRSKIIARKMHHIINDIASYWSCCTNEFEATCQSLALKLKKMKYANWKNGSEAPFDKQSMQRFQRDVTSAMQDHLSRHMCDLWVGEHEDFKIWFDKLFAVCLQEVDEETEHALAKLFDK